MLVLTRKLNEQIKIGDNITITVIKLRNNQIRLGIEAPREVRVLRGELLASIQEDAAPKSADSPQAAPQAAPSTTNRVRTFLTLPPQAEENCTSDAHQSVRTDNSDGLMSAAEMIAAGNESDDDRNDENLSAKQNDDSPRPALQVFSGKIDRDGALRENTPSRVVSSRGRAPLAGYFTAP